jgi:hypothetical protein
MDKKAVFGSISDSVGMVPGNPEFELGRSRDVHGRFCANRVVLDVLVVLG